MLTLLFRTLASIPRIADGEGRFPDVNGGVFVFASEDRCRRAGLVAQLLFRPLSWADVVFAMWSTIARHKPLLRQALGLVLYNVHVLVQAHRGCCCDI